MRIRTLALASVAALGVTAPGWANEYVGTVELGAGWSIINEDGCCVNLSDDSFPLIEGSVRGNIPLTDQWALQLDAGGLATFADRSSDDYLKTVFNAAGHLNYRTDDYAFGLLTQAGSANGAENQNSNFYNFGAEGLYNWADFSAIGQAGYFIADDEDAFDTMTDAWWARAVVRFYAGVDTRVQAEGSYADGEENETPGSDVTAYGWGARIDHSLSGGPVAIFVGYRGTNIENDDGTPESIMDHTIHLGLNLRFGAGSLKEADRNGPSFDTPDVGRWTGWTTDTVE